MIPGATPVRGKDKYRNTKFMYKPVAAQAGRSRTRYHAREARAERCYRKSDYATIANKHRLFISYDARQSSAIVLSTDSASHRAGIGREKTHQTECDLSTTEKKCHGALKFEISLTGEVGSSDCHCLLILLGLTLRTCDPGVGKIQAPCASVRTLLTALGPRLPLQSLEITEMQM